MIDLTGYKKHYAEALGYGPEDFVPSEIPPYKRAVDIHHIYSKGMGGSKTKDTLCNLMAVTRQEHSDYGDIKHLRELLIKIHFIFLFEASRKRPQIISIIRDDAKKFNCQLSKRFLLEYPHRLSRCA